MPGNLRARATSKNGSAGVFRAPSESVMNARARAIHEPERPFPTAHSAGSVICNICSGMNSPAPGVEGLPTRRPVQLPTPEHLHRVLQVIGVLRQAVAAGAGPRPEGGARDPLALERRHAGPDKRRR